MNVYCPRIVNIASQYVGKVGVIGNEMQGADHLIKFLTEAGKNIVMWTPQRRKAIEQGMWLLATKDGGTTNENEPGRISWCGVFACWVLKQAGLNVEWRNSQIQINDPKQMKSIFPVNPADLKAIGRGDVCVINTAGKTNYHHFIVNRWGDPNLETIEGNVSVPRQGVVAKTRLLKDVIRIYRLLVD